MTTPRHFLDLQDVPATTLRRILDDAARLKRGRKTEGADALKGRTLAMIFEKNSTRTRVSFEVGMLEMGGHALPFSSDELQLGRGETVADTARVLSRYVDAVVLRCHAHETLKELAANATIPVINGLSNVSHPCQIMADMLTLEERLGSIAGRRLAWVGDGNNVACTFIAAAARFGFSLSLACPPALTADASLVEWARKEGAEIHLTDSPRSAVEGADAVITDTWVSMGDTDTEARMALLAPYQVNAELMALARPGAIFLHCLPAHRGEEVTAEVIDGPQSAVWDEAENRLHAQKAVLRWCLGADA